MATRDRSRSRSQSVQPENPLLTPISKEEQQLSQLRGSILSLTLTLPAEEERQRKQQREQERVKQRRASLTESGGWQGTVLSRAQLEDKDSRAQNPKPSSRPSRSSAPSGPDQSTPRATSRKRISVLEKNSTASPFQGFVDVRTMNIDYNQYLTSPVSGGSGSQPRSAPPSPSQGMPHTNGMNGGMGMGNGMVGYPTPAGHQSDLNFVMSMVEELSSVLRTNQALTENVVDKMGLVRGRAQHLDLTNDEMIALVAKELNEDSKNLEKENSELRKALEKSEYHRKENFKLACHGASILADVTEKLHRFKEQHESDTLAWHKNYRKQLADEREENLALRNHINDMKASAGRANEYLRQVRCLVFDDPHYRELQIQNIALRQEKRWWKRMALPLIPDDDSEWSDDDDLIDPEEKKRLAAEAQEKQRKKAEEAEGSGEGTSA